VVELSTFLKAAVVVSAMASLCFLLTVTLFVYPTVYLIALMMAVLLTFSTAVVVVVFSTHYFPFLFLFLKLSAVRRKI
jgi:hypothetical protein